jgi:hypothetical protein
MWTELTDTILQSSRHTRINCIIQKMVNTEKWFVIYLMTLLVVQTTALTVRITLIHIS